MRTEEDKRIYNIIHKCNTAITNITYEEKVTDTEMDEIFLGLSQILITDLYNWKRKERKGE